MSDYIVPAHIAEAWLDLYEKEFDFMRSEIKAMLDNLRKQRRTTVSENTKPGTIVESNEGTHHRWIFIATDPVDPEYFWMKLEGDRVHACSRRCSDYHEVRFPRTDDETT